HGALAWTDLLRAMETHIKLADARPGMLTEHAKVLHRRTQGHIASLTNLIDRACYLAIATGVETLTADLLTASTVDNAAHTAAALG
ncbi:MAG: hypothetical protein WAS07_11930, partial [Micropruina sp.]